MMRYRRNQRLKETVKLYFTMQKHRFTTQKPIWPRSFVFYSGEFYFSVNGNFKTAKLAEKIA
ncbi:hypothetical protein CBW18_10165 [Pedobacter sp. AJM]|nr:hypothetical protein CBW18_10165 [Pedobacter sp. AJM]